MKVCGFTFVRNARKFQYPVVEAIQSILPLCTDFVVAVGNSDDDTLELIKSIASPKIRIIETTWDTSLREGGAVLAVETDKAFKEVSHDADWCFYIQADEVLHEQYIPEVQRRMMEFKDDKNVDGLLFKYLHFYGSFDYVGESFRWYRREIRVIRNDKQIFSYRDAQGFRKRPNQKLNVKLIDAYIYHYGWVREPEAMNSKMNSFSTFYHDNQWVEKHWPAARSFDYAGIDALSKFNGTHPAVIRNRIDAMNWKFDHDISRNKFSLKDRFKRFVEKLTGWRPGEYRNYKII